MNAYKVPWRWRRLSVEVPSTRNNIIFKWWDCWKGRGSPVPITSDFLGFPFLKPPMPGVKLLYKEQGSDPVGCWELPRSCCVPSTSKEVTEPWRHLVACRIRPAKEPSPAVKLIALCSFCRILILVEGDNYFLCVECCVWWMPWGQIHPWCNSVEEVVKKGGHEIASAIKAHKQNTYSRTKRLFIHRVSTGGAIPE